MTLKRIGMAVFASMFGAACAQNTVLEESTMTTIDNTGGIALSADGRLELRFPTGALDQSTDITITTQRGRLFPRTKSPIYEFGPDGATFDRKVMVRVTGLVSEEELMFAQIIGDHIEEVPGSTWDPVAGVVTAELEHFSSYAVIQVYNPCAGLACADPCVVCDPLDATCVEPPPAAKACNQSGLCVDAALPMCSGQRDGGPSTPPRDGGSAPTDAGTTPDAGGAPDGGTTPDAGTRDGGIPYCSDTAMQRPQPMVDLLIVMDTSCSMGQEQAALASQFPTLLDTLVQNNTDFHIGTITMRTTAMGHNGALQGNVKVLTSTTPNLANEFANNVVLGTNAPGTSADESGLLAMEQSLTHPDAPLLYRGDASLTVIMVSDEPEQSTDPWLDYVNSVRATKGAYPDRRLQINAISGDVPGGCSGPGGTAAAAPRYQSAAQATGGVFNSICAASYATALTDLGDMGYGYEFIFGLSQVPTSTASLEVYVDGVAVSPGPNFGWSYDAALNSVVFDEFAVPEPNAVVELKYDCP